MWAPALTARSSSSSRRATTTAATKGVVIAKPRCIPRLLLVTSTPNAVSTPIATKLICSVRCICSIEENDFPQRLVLLDYVTVLAAGFDAVVNERANKMTWPRGQMRYNLATLAELRTFEPLPYTLELDGRTLRLDAMLVAVGNGASFGGGLRITEGASLDDGDVDVVIIKPISKPDLVRTYPKLFKGTHVTHPQYEITVCTVTVAAPGIVSYADGERFGALPLTIEAVPER